MVRAVYQSSRTWLPWLAAPVLVGWLGVMSWGGRRLWVSSLIYFVWSIASLQRLSQGPVYLLTDDWLIVPSFFWTRTLKKIPLADAQVQHTRPRVWTVRWRTGNITLREDLKLSPEFGQALAAAAFAAQGSRPRPLAVGAGPAQKMTSRGWWLVGAIILPLVLLLAAAIWQNQPLVLAPAVAILFWPRGQVNYLLLLGDTLVVRSAPHEEALIPVDAITELREPPRGTTTVCTGHPVYPEILLNAYQNAEFVVALRRAMTDTKPGTTAAGTVSASASARCALCGESLLPGVTGQADRAVGKSESTGADICEICAQRTRYEALQTGRGLTGKERPPM